MTDKRNADPGADEVRRTLERAVESAKPDDLHLGAAVPGGPVSQADRAVDDASAWNGRDPDEEKTFGKD